MCSKEEFVDYLQNKLGLDDLDAEKVCSYTNKVCWSEHIANKDSVIFMFPWGSTPEGFDYWLERLHRG